MAFTRLKDFFNGRFFTIPKYQRSYTWEDDNIRDLINDLFEAIQLKSTHYIGTVVLSNNNSIKNGFNIVDGQQRTTTLTIFLNELIKRLSEEDRVYYKRFYIKDGSNRLAPQSIDKDFFDNLLDSDTALLPKSNSQKRMLKAKEISNDRLDQHSNYREILGVIEDLQLMEFVRESDGEAIRIFQTVNDRGKPLSNMEKSKSLLIYYSNRFLNGKFDDEINTKFGEIFEFYDKVKENAEKYHIALLNGRSFNEDNIMRYHFIAFTNDDYDATPEYVLEFIKNRLKDLKGENNMKGLETFISQYLSGLHSCFKSLAGLIEKIQNNYDYLKYFSVLGFNTNLYPLLIVLNNKSFLDTKLPAFPDISIIRLLCIIDIRAYKIRGTNPRAEISEFTYSIQNSTASLDSIQTFLHSYLNKWMNDTDFKSNISGNVYEQFREILPFTLLEYSESLGGTLTFDSLLDVIKDKSKTLTIEHILSQHPTFNHINYGFKSLEEYSLKQHTYGNLTLIEKGLNSSAQNKNPFEKISVYSNSGFKITTRVGNLISSNSRFTEQNISLREQEITAFVFDKYGFKTQQP